MKLILNLQKEAEEEKKVMAVGIPNQKETDWNDHIICEQSGTNEANVELGQKEGPS